MLCFLVSKNKCQILNVFPVFFPTKKCFRYSHTQTQVQIFVNLLCSLVLFFQLPAAHTLTRFPSTSSSLLFISHKSMLSNCILSMSTTSLQPPAFYPFILPSYFLHHSFDGEELFQFDFFLFCLSPISTLCLPLSLSRLHPYLLRLVVSTSCSMHSGVR